MYSPAAQSLCARQAWRFAFAAIFFLFWGLVFGHGNAAAFCFFISGVSAGGVIGAMAARRQFFQ